ncbi:inositol monophosphatase [bacterium]|nr:inositol monophosphatase [bacterium]
MEKLFSYVFNLTLEAGNILKKNFQSEKKYEMKNEREIVTDTDKEIERFFFDNILKKYPNMNFIAEEEHLNGSLDGDTIILDPIDGTNNFFYKLPFVAISIAYYKDGEGIFGIVFNPILEEMFIGKKGEGAFLNGEKIKVSSINQINQALLGTGLPYKRDNERNNLDNIVKFGIKCRDIRRFGSAALDICYVAKGTFDGYWELQLKIWDVAAAAVVLKEAGGKLTNFDNNSLDLRRDDFLASNVLLHNKMQDVLQKEAV